MIKRILLIVLVAIMALGLGVYFRFMGSPVEFSLNKKEILKDFVLTDLWNNPHSVNEWQGRIRIINFWATWCPPCLKEIPDFIALQEQYTGKNIQFIGVAIDNKESVEQFLSSKTINYPILLAENEGLILAHQLGNIMNSVPYTIVVNQQGLIVKQYQGEVKKDELLKVIESLVQ